TMTTLNDYALEAHAANRKWWQDPNSKERIERNKGELLCLIHSEISEAMEGERKNLMDDKLPHRRMAEVELADALIRIFDYAGAFGYDLGGPIKRKWHITLIVLIINTRHALEKTARSGSRVRAASFPCRPSSFIHKHSHAF
ncbi:hypothetical protein, partial [Enterobacter cloacae complex sp. 4DZ1-17B1]|uniref:hypothetical protein n=1 Tax=Enterobacter cloacae complex sp. 4DZ1-17B1 TaxID=2511991 RepID=UPI001CA575D8